MRKILLSSLLLLAALWLRAQEAPLWLRNSVISPDGPAVVPLPGTMTAVWWETQIDPSLVFGIPQVTVVDTKGTVMENNQLEPDVEVYNSPESLLSGDDMQLKRAVEELLKSEK